MKKLWFITNPASGTTSAEKCEAIEAVFDERGLSLAGRTNFPESQLPEPEELAKAGVDTIVLFAGDGTINATLCKFADWDGAYLILPGGTMNLLAKALHDTLDPHEIIHAAFECDRRVALPYVEAGPHRGFVGLILGPAAHWVTAREAVREGNIRRLFGAVRAAWRRTFGARGVRIAGAGLRKRYQAVFVTPDHDGLHVAAVDARDWGSIIQLGWDWLTGDWIAARAVDESRASELTLLGRRRRRVMALFDGEPVRLDRGTRITGGTTRKAFIATKAATS